VWSNDPKSYAGSSVATGRAFHARQGKGDDPDKKGYPGPPGWGLGVGLTTPSHKKIFVEKLLKFETGQQFWKMLKSTKDCNATRRSPNMLSLLGDPRSGNGCGSANNVSSSSSYPVIALGT
jgi:hypothetical protein